MKHTLYAILAMAICTLWTACEEDYEVIPPTFKGFLYSPTTVHAGDSVKFTACYANAGQQVYFVGHKGITWKLSVDTLDAGGDESKNGRWQAEYKPYCSIGEGEPTIKLRIPTSAKPGSTARLDFNASYSNACNGAPNVSLPNPTAEGYYGQFSNSVIQSALYSGVSGWMTFIVN